MIISDGGRYSSNYKDEHLDCTVRALATAGDIPYDLAHRILEIHGRKRRRGFNTDGTWAIITGNVCCRRHGTVRKFLDAFPTGRFIVDTRHHSLAVIDGEIHDFDPDEEEKTLGSFVKGAWRVDVEDLKRYAEFALRYAKEKGI